jgi:hypothetical protein
MLRIRSASVCPGFCLAKCRESTERRPEVWPVFELGTCDRQVYYVTSDAATTTTTTVKFRALSKYFATAPNSWAPSLSACKINTVQSQTSEHRFLGSLPFVIAHFNTFVSTFREWLLPIGMRPRGWRVGCSPLSCHCAEHCQRSEFFVFQEVGLGFSCFMQWDCLAAIYGVLWVPKSVRILLKINFLVFMFFEVTFCFCDSYLISSWKQILHSKWIPMFVMPTAVTVLSAALCILLYTNECRLYVMFTAMSC